MKICNCGTENVDEAIFCKRCGTKFLVEQIPQSGLFCLNCHADNPPNAIYCRKCGIPLKSKGKVSFSVNTICDVYIGNKLSKTDVKSSYTFQEEEGTYVVRFQSKQRSDVNVVKTVSLIRGENQAINIDLRTKELEGLQQQEKTVAPQISTSSWEISDWFWLIMIAIGIAVFIWG